MNHRSRPAIALLCVAPLIGCGSRDQAPVPKTSVKTAVRAPAPRNPKIPAEVSYLITSERDEGPLRRVVEVRLNTKVTPEVLREIALEVKAKEEIQHERTAIYYYLPVEFPELAGQPWASTHFNPVLDVKIMGLSKQEEDTLRGIQLDHKGDRVGAWLPDDQYKTLDLIYDEEGAIKIAEIRSPTERIDSDMIELPPSPTGRRFQKVKGSNIYDVDLYGNLRISNAEGRIFSAAKPMRGVPGK